jgi:ATP-dependent Lon protease
MSRDDRDLKKIVITSLEELLKQSQEEDGDDAKRRRVTRSNTRKRPQAPDIKNPQLRFYASDEKNYYNDLDDEEKKFIAELEKEIKDLNKEHIPIRFKVLMSNIDKKVKAIAVKKLQLLKDMDHNSSEYYKNTNWIESLCRLPIGRYKDIPISSKSSVCDIRNFIKKTKEALDETVYGHHEAKDQIIRFLAQRISNPNSVGNNVIGLEGPPGVGKTLIAKWGISRALDLPFQFVSLSGSDDSSHFTGHSFTYEGSTFGKIADMLMKAEWMNCIIFMDELDKVSQTYKGEEISHLLVHITDSTQNDKFQDRYFMDVDIDLSKCLFIFSYNDAEKVNPILKDRMIKIKVAGYKVDDKIKIAQNYLLKDLCKQFNFPRDQIIVPDNTLRHLINNRVEKEQGVRNLKRALELILSNINLNILLAEENMTYPVTVTEEIANQYVKLPKDITSETFMYV